MSHHFDTRIAKDDPSLNVCDLYLFQGAPGSTVMAMTVNPDVGLSVPDTLHVEGIYAFRFDVDGDSRENVAFKFRFGEPGHASGSGSGLEASHLQQFQVRRGTGEAIHGDGGELLIEGETGGVKSQSGVRVYAGTAPDLFAGNAAGLQVFLSSFHKEQRYNGDAFLNRQNYFANRNITALVLEVPTETIGQGKVGAWATTSLHGHAPEVQIQRWGLPLITHIFLSGSVDLKDKFRASVPADDPAAFADPIAEFVEKMTTYARSAADPSEYGRQVAARLCPTMLPYELGTKAAFDRVGFNGRALGDDVMDTMLAIASNIPLADGVAPDLSRTRNEFPYFGRAYTRTEQAGVTPVPQSVRN